MVLSSRFNSCLKTFWRIDINTNKTIRSKYPGGRCVTLKLKHQSVIVKSTWSYQLIMRIEIMIKVLCISCWLTFLSFICDWCSNALILIIRYIICTRKLMSIVIQKALSSLAANMHHAIIRLYILLSNAHLFIRLQSIKMCANFWAEQRKKSTG